MPNNTATEMAVNLVLPLSMVNTVLKGLGELPLKESRMVSETIEAQARADIQRQQEFANAGKQDANAAPGTGQSPAS